jgi:TonB family protein
MVDVTDVLRDRMREPAGLQQMVVVSMAVHVGVAIALLFAPGRWIGRVQDTPHTVMTISLGGGGGPRSGGMTAMGDRPVQVQSPEPPKPREPVRPPAAKIPEMTVPTKNARHSRTAPAPVVNQAPEGAKGRTPTRGPQPRFGSSMAETGTRGQGFGLSSGGGPGSGSTLDVADFCCPDYLVLMIEAIRRSWNQNQGSGGQVIVRFTIQRDGTLTDVTVERPTGDPTLNMAAQRAVVVTRKLPPLPDAFPNQTLTVHLNFQYQR